jgi:hypothetical protein
MFYTGDFAMNMLKVLTLGTTFGLSGFTDDGCLGRVLPNPVAGEIVYGQFVTTREGLQSLPLLVGGDISSADLPSRLSGPNKNIINVTNIFGPVWSRMDLLCTKEGDGYEAIAAAGIRALDRLFMAEVAPMSINQRGCIVKPIGRIPIIKSFLSTPLPRPGPTSLRGILI